MAMDAFHSNTGTLWLLCRLACVISFDTSDSTVFAAEDYRRSDWSSSSVMVLALPVGMLLLRFYHYGAYDGLILASKELKEILVKALYQ